MKNIEVMPKVGHFYHHKRYDASCLILARDKGTTLAWISGVGNFTIQIADLKPI